MRCIVLKNRLFFVCILGYFFCNLANASEAKAGSKTREILHIGILAHRGNDHTRKKWFDTSSYLQEKIPNYSFNIIPLNNDDIEQFVKSGHVDFILTNPASYARLENKFGVHRLATLLNANNGGTYTKFGAVIFSRRDRNDISTLDDLKNKTFMAVHRKAFGGWWMAKWEIIKFGLDPMNDFSDLKFISFPQDKIVLAVRDGIVDAGTVRTNILERMHQSGQINIDNFKILNPKKYNQFNQRLSTALYPEWPFSAARHVPYELSQRVALALFDMKQNSVAAQSAMIQGWTAPLDYQPVHELMRNLKVGPYKNLGKVSVQDIFKDYWIWIASVAAIFLSMITIISYIVGLNRKNSIVNNAFEREISVREELEAELKHQALHDSLTNLPNRNLLLDRLRQATYTCERENLHCAVAVIDLDKFKRVNDELGHEFGDKLLKQVAERLQGNVRRTDTLSRFGGDEFVLLLQNVSTIENVVEHCQKCLQALEKPFSFSGRVYQLGASIGVAFYPFHGEIEETLLRHADLAMYNAKQKKGNCIVTYNKNINSFYTEEVVM